MYDIFLIILYHRRKTDQLRIMFDRTVKYRNESFNSTLLQGPDLTNPLVQLLLTFCKGRFAFIEDIKSMLFQVPVPVKSYFRFLWWPYPYVNIAWLSTSLDQRFLLVVPSLLYKGQDYGSEYCQKPKRQYLKTIMLTTVWSQWLWKSIWLKQLMMLNL